MSETTGAGRHPTDHTGGISSADSIGGTGSVSGGGRVGSTDHRAPGTGRAAPVGHVAHESYSFACLRCGHGWEQSYEIVHQVDARGARSVVYRADGRQVPSPLSRPTCDHCGGHVVRIMRPGRVSTVLDSLHAGRPNGSTRAPRDGGSRAAAAGEPAVTGAGAGGRPAGGGRPGRQLWHVPDLLRLLHLPRSGR